MTMAIVQKIKEYLAEERYNIGFVNVNSITSNPEGLYEGINWLNLSKYRDGWFADPFLLSVDDIIIEVLVEEYVYKAKKGRITKLVVDRHNYKLMSVVPVLELSTHLSFPSIYREGDAVYVVPENFQSGSVYLYKYDSSSEKLINPVAIINQPLVDCQIMKYNNLYYLFGLYRNTGSMEESKEIGVYTSYNLTGPFQPFSTLSGDTPTKRGAGAIYSDSGLIIRPSQNCYGGYGKGVIFNELSLVDGKVFENERMRISPYETKRFGISLHTFNKLDSICVVDGSDYRYGKLVRILKNRL